MWPSLLLGGVQLKAHKPSEGYGGDSYVYPVRSGTDANYLTPSQIAMYMTPQVRRVAVMASRIPIGAIVKIRNTLLYNERDLDCKLSALVEEQNIIQFDNTVGGPGPTYPLDCVRTVYEAWDPNAQKTVWRMILEVAL